MQTLSMLMAKGIWQKIVDFFLGLLAFLPQSIYFLYASMASLLDVLQYLVRKLAGLDVYYIDGVAQGGDILTDFLKGIVGINKSTAYSAISTVFWSLVIFGVILLILTSIVAIIKAHYNYDANKANPFTILRGALKALATMVIVPIVSIFGIYLSQILLMALDEITSPTASTAISSTYEADAVNKFASDDDGVYTSYDYFSAGGYTKTPTFSGMLFKVSAYNCNRVRSGYYSATTNVNAGVWDTAGVFYTSSDRTSPHEVVAAQIDYAFVNNLKLKEPYAKIEVDGKSESDTLSTSLRFGLSATFSAGLFNVKSFSKFNVGLVFYYYDLWAFNSILGFAGVAMAALTLGNIVFGLMGRLLQVVALFVIYPAFIGIMPLDDGNAFGQWRKQFTSDILMAFGAVVGMNVFFLILPYFDQMSFFNEPFLDGIANMIIILAGLTLVKKFIGLVSKFAGGGDANESGSSIKADTAQAAMKGMSGTLKAAGPASKIIANRGRAAIGATIGLGKKLHEIDERNKNKKAYNSLHEGDKKKWKDMTDEDIAEGAQYRAENSRAQKNAQKKAQKKAEKMAAYWEDKRKHGNPEKIADFMGYDGANPWLKAKNVKEDDKEIYAKMFDKEHGLDKAERDAIMEGAYEKDEKGEFKKGADGEKIPLKGEDLKNYLKGQLGVGADSTAYNKHLANVKTRELNKTAEKKYKRAVGIGKIFGQDTSKYTQGSATVDDDGNIQVTKGTSTLKGFGQAALDIGDAMIKTVGSLSGATGAWKKLSESGVIDEAKTAIQNITGITPKKALGPVDFRTKKQSDEQEKKELDEMRKSQLKGLESNAELQKQIVELLASINNSIKDKKGGES